MSHHHHESTEVQFGTSKKSLKAYLIGFVLCVGLTLLPFWLVVQRVFPDKHLYVLLLMCAVAQLYVQVVCFLRVNASPEGRWNLLSLLFTFLVLLVIVIGSMWIMYNLDYNMAM
jgi:cytochrome o ubiquinol oxidase subunit IV